MPDAGDRGSARLQSLLHQRLTSPLLTVLFALIAVPLGLRVERTGNLAIPAALQICARHHATMLYLRFGGTAVLARPTRLAEALGRLIS